MPSKPNKSGGKTAVAADDRFGFGATSNLVMNKTFVGSPRMQQVPQQQV
jgi:hypothetical protein